MNLESNDIKLFLKTETSFEHNKRILSDAIECFVTETTDGIFDLDLTYPLNDKKQLSGDLARENIIKSAISQTDSRGEQLFTIRKRSLNSKANRVVIYAQAKARRDLDMNMILGLEVPAGQTRKQACQMLLTKCVEQQGYTIGNLDTNSNTSINLGLDENTGAVINYLDISGISPLKGFLSDSENSIYKAYGGEIIYNNYEINMVDERGTDNNILIESGKNLEELQQDIDDLDTENFATAVLPCSADGVYLPNSEIIYSPNAATLGKVFKRVVYDDVTLVNNTTEALNVVYAQLRERVQKDFDNGLDKLKINNTIKYIQLINTEEYKPYAKLFTEKCEIGNNVTVRYYMNNDKTKYIDAVGRVVKIKFNVLKNRIEEIEIGDRKKKSIVTTINNVVNATTTNTEKVNTVVQTGDTVGTYKMSERAFKECCIGASNNYTKINEEGVTIYDGQFRMYKDGTMIFYVNANGKCTAQGGFAVEDGDECCYIDKTGVQITNENGYTSKMSVIADSESATMLIPDHLRIKKNLHVEGYTELTGELTVDGGCGLNGNVYINGSSIEALIDERIAASNPTP